MSENGGRANCILGVCCSSLSDRRNALAADMVRDLKCNEAEAVEMAGYILEHYDLAPKDSLKDLYKDIKRLAREGFIPEPGSMQVVD